jgi:hypothetical protein
MSNRSWFFAANGQQQGPYQEAQFRDLIARGGVTAQTLVWSDGMSGWQKAGDVPGLMAGAAAPAPPAARPGTPALGGAAYGADNPGSYVAQGAYGSGNAMSLDLGIWDFTWRTLAFVFGSILVIPIPWLLCWYVGWFTSRVQVPGRPNLSFAGSAGKIAIWFFGAFLVVILLGVIAAITRSQAIGNLGSIVQFVMYYLFLRYFIANLASNGQPLGLSFTGSFWAYFGWNLLLVISLFTIIGWAWVLVAQLRWICRNIQGTRRQIVFKGTGLELLWRAIVASIGAAFIIPIPWVYRWMLRWQLSQTELVERGAYTSA